MSKIYQKKNPDGKTPAKGRFGGFTLIELLVVVLIIGILAAIAWPQYKKAVFRAKAAQALVTFDAIIKAEELYSMANGTLADDLSELDLDLSQEEAYIGCEPAHSYCSYLKYINEEQLFLVWYPKGNCPKECRARGIHPIALNYCASLGPKMGSAQVSTEWNSYCMTQQ